MRDLWFGLGRADVTACVPGLSMWGWGSTENVPVGAAAPLHARALVIAEGPDAPPAVLVCVELGFVSEALRREALAALQRRGVDVDEHRFTLTATHTHSGPSGFSTYLFYGLPGPGFSPVLLARLVSGIVDAVLAAARSMAPGRVFLAAESIPLVEPVSFNRSIDAYNRNPDVTPLRLDRRDEAVDRRMTVLRFEGAAGNPRGLLSFFPVHGTSIHADSNLLHPDNKGAAAHACERAFAAEGARDFVAIFAQEAAGDVSPNYRWDPRRRVMVGRFDDDFESVAYSGEAQARHAERLFRSARETGTELHGPVSASLRYAAFHRAPPGQGPSEASPTSEARVGMGFCRGTAEGPGPLGRTPGLARVLDRLCTALQEGSTDPTQSPKPVFWDLGTGAMNRILGRLSSEPLLLGLARSRHVRFYQEALRLPAVRRLPWVPHHLPFQILRIGSFAAGLVPFEPTTVAGRRIRAGLLAELSGAGVREVVAAGYANAYASYLTTPEEYDAQAYEGGMTLFGRGSLPATLSWLREVARGLVAGTPHVTLGEPPETAPLDEWLPSVDGAAGRRWAAPPARAPRRHEPRWALPLARAPR